MDKTVDSPFQISGAMVKRKKDRKTDRPTKKQRTECNESTTSASLSNQFSRFLLFVRLCPLFFWPRAYHAPSLLLKHRTQGHTRPKARLLLLLLSSLLLIKIGVSRGSSS